MNNPKSGLHICHDVFGPGGVFQPFRHLCADPSQTYPPFKAWLEDFLGKAERSQAQRYW